MSWLFPGFLAASLGIGLPIVLHLLRSRPKTQIYFPSLRFLGPSAVQDTKAHRLRRWITLLLRCAIILFLAAAFARPFFSDRTATMRQAVVVALDNSMSMQAGNRFENAKKWAIEQIADLRPGDRAAVLVMHPTPVWQVPFTDDLSKVRAAISDWKPGYETTRYSSAFRLAGTRLSDEPARARTLVWAGDEQRMGWTGVRMDETLPPGVKVRFFDPQPSPGKQATIVSATEVLEAGKPALEVQIRQFSPPADQRVVSLYSDGQKVAEKRVQLKEGTENRVRFESLPDESAGALKVAMDADQLAADDTFYIVRQTHEARPVLLDFSGEGGSFLSHALDSTRKLKERGLHPVPLEDRPWEGSRVAILQQGGAFTGASRERLDQFLDGGGAALIFVDGSPEQRLWLRERGISIHAVDKQGELGRLRDLDSEHPVFAPFSGESLLPILDVDFRQSFSLSGTHLVRVAGWEDGSTAIAEWSERGKRVFLCGFPVNRQATNWPLKPSFVPFLHQAVVWLSELSQGKQEWRIGETVPIPAGIASVKALEVSQPEPERKVNGQFRAMQPGIYEFGVGSARTLFAVNPAVDESDLAPWPDPGQLAALESKDAALQASHVAQSAIQANEMAESQQRIWWWLLVACILFLFAELTVANRTAV